MESREFDPLFGEPRDEVRLANPPLARSIAQVQFGTILMVRSEDFIAPFQEAIRSDYPNFTSDVTPIHPLLSGGDAAQKANVTWRFVDDEGNWRVSLSTGFLALECMQYTSRADFMARFGTLLDAFGKTVRAARLTRVGVRYVDHVKAPEFDLVDEMLRPEMRGIATSTIRDKLQYSVSETICTVAEGELLARWGVLPPHGTHDPGVMPPSSSHSWFLDLDVFKQYEEPYPVLEVGETLKVADALAVRSYAFFRWAVTDQFLEVYGREA